MTGNQRLSIHCLPILSALVIFFSTPTSSSYGGDWPMWRYDSGRGSSSPDALPADLQLQWTRQLPKPQPAWPGEQTKLLFDLRSEPVVMEHRIFVPSNRHDSVTAFDTRTGEELWRFYADGPVRFAPVAHEGKVFFNSDDGFLYCIDAEEGRLIWKVNGGPTERRILGNHRLVSSWPARGGVVLHEEKLFFAASIWPFMGIFVHAVDPESGEILWTNSGDGTNYTIQPHDAPSFAGLVPQGHLAASGDSLVVPGGRSTPGVYQVETGEQILFNFDKRLGGHDVGIIGDLIFTAGHAYTREKGQVVGGGAPAVFDGKTLLASDPNSLLGREAKVDFAVKESTDRKGKKTKEISVNYHEQFKTSLKAPIPGQWFLKAGDRYFAGGDRRVAAYEVGKAEPVWQGEVERTVATMLAADDRLFVVTDDNRLHCFGAGKPDNVTDHALADKTLVSLENDRWTEQVATILSQKGMIEGYAIALGIGSGRLIEELLAQSDLHVIAIDSDPEKVKAFRDRMTDAGWYGDRCAAILDDPLSANLPPYLANLIVSESIELGDDGLATVFQALRPYGGTAFLGIAGKENAPLDVRHLAKASLKTENGFTILVREGALPDTDDWTHQYANAAQTVVSGDHLVKAPFGVLWFGGPSHEGVLPRHGHGPSPQVAGGRLFIEGPDMLRAVDVYTGRLLWERELKGFGEYYDVTAHFAGAGEIGSNYVSLADGIYAVYGEKILELDPANGETRREYQLPAPAPDEPSPFWGHAVVSGDYLIATSSPISVDAKAMKEAKADSENKVELVPRNATWSYLASEEAIKNWMTPDFTEGADWKRGQAGFGYGDNDDKTLVKMQGKSSRLLIRHEIDTDADPAAIESLALEINFDDGFIAYLNGKEVIRRGVKHSPGGKIDVASHEAGGMEMFEIKGWRDLVREGKNVIAIEGHNRSAGSSDFTLDPVLAAFTKSEAEGKPEEIAPARYASGSRRLVVFDRKSGEKLWEREAALNFRHNNIAASGDRLYCIDQMTKARAAILSRRGMDLSAQPALYALDLKTGNEIWSRKQGVFGTFLNFSAEHDVLLQGGSAYRDRAADEIGAGLMGLRGADGSNLWHHPLLEYHGPCLLWHDKILTNGAAGFSLNLLTGEKTGWGYSRMYGCNTAVGSEHLMTFRSGAAGFFDLALNSGTGNLGGFKSSCTNNLIPANGVLNAPDYTRTCVCSYQNQTSLALVHMPEAEFWTFGGQASNERIGINFGAPGDRRSEEGTLFCEYPETGGVSDSAKVTIEGDQLRYPRIHASLTNGAEPGWITASGVEGASKISVELPEELQKAQCELRLWFAGKSSDKNPDQNRFDLLVNGERKIEGLEISEGDGGLYGFMKVIDGLKTDTSITLEFVASSDFRPPMLCGLEIIRR